VQAALTVAPTRLTVNQREYLAAPAVLIVCGVLNQGLITEEELDPEAWNGTVITVNHPMDSQGRAISARSPGVTAQQAVGHVYNAMLGIGSRQGQPVASLCAELWLDIETMKALGAEAFQALQMVESQTPMDVSTGFYSVAEPVSGTMYGQDYTEIHHNIRPDHLALLPNGTGACSWSEDGGGCGVPRFHAKDACDCGGTCAACQEMLPMDDPSPTRLQALWTMLARFFHEDPLITNVLSSARRPTYSGTESTAWSAPSLADAIKALGGDSTMQAANVADLPASMKRKVAALSLLGDPAADNARDLLFFPVVNPRTGKLNEGALRAVISGRGSQANIPAAAKTSAQTMARRLLNSAFDAGLETQQTAPEDEPEDTPTDTTPARCPACNSFLPDAEPGEDVECPNCGHVTTMADVRPTAAAITTDTQTTPETQEEDSMPTESVKRRVDALIANERTGWKETDREHLEAMDEFMLLRLEQQPQTAPTRKAQTAEELITEMYAEPSVQQTVRAMYKDYQTRKTRAIEVLLALPKRPQSLTEERMQAMEADDLEEYILMAGADVPLRPGVPGTRDYSGRGGPARREVSEEEQVPPIPKTFQLVVEQQRKLGLIS